MPVVRESGIAGNRAIHAKTANPAVGQIQVKFLASPPLRADAAAVADNQHPDQLQPAIARPAASPHSAKERRQQYIRPAYAARIDYGKRLAPQGPRRAAGWMGGRGYGRV